MLALLILPLVILGFSAVSAMIPVGLSSLANAGPHGLSEILYAYSSAAGNNGSAFAGLNANTPWYNTTLGIAMFLGRFAYHRADDGDCRLARRQDPGSGQQGKLPDPWRAVRRPAGGVILILGGLQYFPALALGPIVEHFLMLAGKTF